MPPKKKGKAPAKRAPRAKQTKQAKRAPRAPRAKRAEPAPPRLDTPLFTGPTKSGYSAADAIEALNRVQDLTDGNLDAKGARAAGRDLNLARKVIRELEGKAGG